MPAVLFDTSVYVAALRGDSGTFDRLRHARNSVVWLSAVVLEELYAGSSAHSRRRIQRLERDFHNVGRLLVPSLSDWTQTGRVLAQFAARYGFEPIGRGRLTNDTLIATSAARMGIQVWTLNEKDYTRIAAIQPFRWRLYTP